MNLRIYLLIWICLGLVGCELGFMESSQKPLYLGVNDNVTSIRRFGTCSILYKMTDFTSNIDQQSQLTALRNAAGLWNKTHGYLELKEVVNQVPAITVTFTDSPIFPSIESDKGLISQNLDALSVIRRDPANNGCTILLRRSFPWTTSVLQRVLVYQIGVALGFKDSEDLQSAMSLSNQYEQIRLSESDSIALTTLYNQPCDEWTKLETRILPSASELIRVKTYFDNHTKGYCIVDMLSGRNKVFEFDPSLATNNWAERTAFPGLVTTSTNLALVSFTVGTRMFAGNLYSTQIGKFWEYIPAVGNGTDSWKPIADCPLIGADTYAVGLGNKGYLISKLNRDDAWSVWTYDPTTNKWAQESTLALTNSGILTRISDSVSFSIGKSAYIITQNTCWRFRPEIASAPWQKITPLGANGSFSGFSSRGYGFLARGFSTQLWRFSEADSWQLCKSLPESRGAPYLLFSIQKRVFFFWNTELSYRYNP
ncbi:hypothetical protein P1X15_08685 [Runella sp. MFBS21]|uniref:hypothetical protein n=1 Tax=Runella sp. MFBS21 TaxID=3034018 RepID=UPI0023F9BCAD|nr:hypothetical protein [Runella sp. MFBS21]MDF7817670.1 hypothetical protein [Runella sp. MFBS21]